MLLPESVRVPAPILVREPELMMLPEKFELKPFVSIVPPRASSEIVRAVIRLPVVCKVPPLKSTNVPKPSGVRAASLAIDQGASLSHNKVRP